MANNINNFCQRVTRKLKYLYQKCRNAKLIDSSELYKYWEHMHLKQLFELYAVDCVFDVGANYGQYAQMLRNEVGFQGLIISFEPLPAAAAHLREKSKNDPLWVIVETALSSSNGEQTFNVMEDSQFSTLSSPRHDQTDLFSHMNKVAHAVTVKTETLEVAYQKLKSQHHFTRPFLKLDTQGFDVSIVTSSNNVLKEFVAIQSELAVKKLYEHSVDFREAITIYERYGFTLSAFIPNNAGHFPTLIETDCLMVNANFKK